MDRYDQNLEMFTEEQPVYRSVATHYNPEEEQQLNLDGSEFGSGKNFGYQSAAGFGKSSTQTHSSSSALHGGYAPSSTSLSSKPQPYSRSVSRAPGYQIVQPPRLFDSYYDRCYSFESGASPDEVLNVLQTVLESSGCECKVMRSDAKIQVTQFVDFAHITCEANLFTKDADSDLVLVEINRLRGCCMKFHTFYTHLVSALCSQYGALFSEIQDASPQQAPSVPSPSPSNSHSHSHRSTSHSSRRQEEAILDASAAGVPCRPNLRRSPSSNGGLREVPLAPHEPHPFGPTRLSRDLLTSLIAFCRSKCFEQQRDGLELLARLSGEPTNKKAIVQYAREILCTVAALLPSRDCGIQHSACALVAHVLAASRCDIPSLFPGNGQPPSRSHSRSAPSEPRGSNSSSSDSDFGSSDYDNVDPKSMFSNISSLLFGQSRHVRDAASNVLGCVATESEHPELVKSPMYLNWLREDNSVRARSILRRLGAGGAH